MCTEEINDEASDHEFFPCSISVTRPMIRRGGEEEGVECFFSRAITILRVGIKIVIWTVHRIVVNLSTDDETRPRNIRLDDSKIRGIISNPLPLFYKCFINFFLELRSSLFHFE